MSKFNLDAFIKDSSKFKTRGGSKVKYITTSIRGEVIAKVIPAGIGNIEVVKYTKDGKRYPNAESYLDIVCV